VVATVVSIYYYLGVVRAMYMQPGEMRLAPAGGSPPRDVALHMGVGLALLVTVGSFLAADPLIDIARDAVDLLAFPH
jgi:NADH:ubiquinone oxidoreductase subunit 2 (subunit N)